MRAEGALNPWLLPTTNTFSWTDGRTNCTAPVSSCDPAPVVSLPYASLFTRLSSVCYAGQARSPGLTQAVPFAFTGRDATLRAQLSLQFAPSRLGVGFQPVRFESWRK